MGVQTSVLSLKAIEQVFSDFYSNFWVGKFRILTQFSFFGCKIWIFDPILKFNAKTLKLKKNATQICLTPNLTTILQAELKRVYTQLRMYKLKNLYQDNPHISKRKGGKKTSDKAVKNRRISIPATSSSPKIRRVDEEEEKSDLTVESAPHNIYLSTNKIQLEDLSVRV